jgi:hypothetical protein
MKTKILLTLTQSQNDMKRLFLGFVILFCITLANAQNPFEAYGYTPKIATLSNGKYNEFHDLDTIVQIGTVLYNTQTKQIVAFLQIDTLYSEATLQPDIVSMWMSPDPLSSEYPSNSPYMYCLGNPIVFIDPDGRFVDWYKNEAGEIVYDESIRHQVDFNKSGIKGTYLGKTYQQGSKYYSLFGEVKDLKTTEGKLYQKMDEALINNAYFTNRMRKWNESGGYDETTMPTEARTNFDIGLKMKYDAFGLSETYSNIIEFSYNGAKGYYFNFENKESLIGTLDWNPGQGYSSNKHKGVGYPLDGGYNVFIRPSKGYRSDTYCILLVFNSQSSKSNFYEKWRKEFLVK